MVIALMDLDEIIDLMPPVILHMLKPNRDNHENGNQ